ncbi:hypothetical protein SAMN04488066_101140 [Halorubrum aquaticum]|uniref:Uncharacterized protein n=1 Tax=Halorubrum aquaticum TaxID=387340 RepID=A0A1I2Z2L1_9EURY|nr:hypothetical protein [Halorubrum aquaticum]SFH31779.1 hypothetical protein SAMN04488066_101140 [Halorubrum aquaticum]
MDALSRLPVWLRNPRYTGSNRCLPCTIVNVVIAAGLALVVATVSVGWALATFAVAAATIAVRGYLVPGTPALTKRYLPDRVLALFDKGPERGGGAGGAVADEVPSDHEVSFDPATALVEAGVLLEDPVVDDFVLEEGFHDAWRREARTLADADADEAALAEFLEFDPGSIALVDRGHAYAAYIEDEPAGRWESRQAFLADLAAADVLEAYWDDWKGLSTARRSELLGSLRLFVETCPTCDGDVTLGTTVVESCCRQYDVLAATCEACGARLFEADVDPETIERAAEA